MVFIWVAAERRGGAGDFFFMALITAGFELGDSLRRQHLQRRGDGSPDQLHVERPPENERKVPHGGLIY